jgi:hypothetical protein
LLSPEAVEALKKTEDWLDQLRLQVKILNELWYGDKIKSSYNCPKEIDDDELEFGSCQSVVAGALYRRRADKTQEEIDEMNKKAYDHLITNL